MNTYLKLIQFKNYPSINFAISGKTILDDILYKCFSKYAYFGWINLYILSYFIVYNTFFTPYHAILQYSIPDAFAILYGVYSTDFCFDPPMQSSLNIYVQYSQFLMRGADFHEAKQSREINSHWTNVHVY